MNKAVCLLLLAVLFVPATGCDKASPVAPEGTILTVSASPSRIGLNGASTITVIGRKPNGSALNPGTEIRFSTDRGTINPTVAEIQDGVATATLLGDGRSGEATVTVAAAATTATVKVQVGETDTTRPTLIVSANPSTVPVQGTATVTVIAREQDGSPVQPGQDVTLTTTLGSFTDSTPTITSGGTATTTLRAGTQAGTATITAILGASAAVTTTVNIRDAATNLLLSATPASIPRTGGEVELTAFVSNAQGEPVANAPVSFTTSRGTLTTFVLTGSDGTATSTLEVTQSQIGNNTNNITVSASTPSGTGTAISKSLSIDIE